VDPLTTATVYAVGVPIILALIVFEVALSTWQNRHYYRLRDTLGSLGLMAGNILAAGALKLSILGFSLYLYQFRLFTISELLPTWAVWLLTFFLIDLVFYWYHRASHRSHFLWAVHMNHHCSQEMNFLVAFRQAWFGPLSKVPFFAVLPLLGLDPTMTVVAGAISTLWGVVGHTQIVDKLGPLEWLFNTPSHHRVHHGTNPEYIDKNYGNLFIIWDRMFGTFVQEKALVVFGLTNNIETINPFKITFHTWITIVNRMRASASVGDALRCFFGPPEWCPAGNDKKR